MPLLQFWKNAKDDVLKMTIEQVIASAGDGNLRDNSECSEELRTFLKAVPSDLLFAYTRRCLESKFDKSGFALQDILNELGRRLDFDVESGLYQGKRNAIGFDGIWRSKGQPDLIIEAKTTDIFTISLDDLVAYKDKLVSEGRVQREASTLIVVGRSDTGALEAQVRGSRHAWVMRLISVEGLIKLVQVKEKSDDPATIHQIRQLLQPFEYTKIDRIIDVIFTTAVDVEIGQTNEQEAPVVEVGEDQQEAAGKQVRTDPELLNAKRQQAVEAFAAAQGKELVKRSRTLFWSPDKELRVCCAVSKRHEGDRWPYWYGYDRKWDGFLAEGKESYFIISCMDRDEAFALPYSWLQENKKNLNVTEKGGKLLWWHVATTTLDDGKLAINMSKVGTKIALEPYRYSLKRQVTQGSSQGDEGNLKDHVPERNVMNSGRAITQWQKGPVDRTEEHFELRYGSTTDSDWIPAAVVGPPIAGIVNVQFLVEPEDPRNSEVVSDVAREIEFYLIDKGEPNPWWYAKYHCGTSANLYSKVHWSFSKPTGEKAIAG